MPIFTHILDMTPLKDSKVADLTYWKKFAYIFIDSFIMFRTNQVPIRAGGLSFSSLLAFVPFAIIFSWIAGLTGHVKLLAEVVPELNKNWGVNIPLENLQKIIFNIRDFIEPYWFRKLLSQICRFTGIQVEANSKAVGRDYFNVEIKYPIVKMGQHHKKGEKNPII